MKTHKHIRLPDFDYCSEGYYFVTICVNGRKCLLSEIKEAQSLLTEQGFMVDDVITDIPTRYAGVVIDCTVIMPNHIHVIIGFTNHQHSLFDIIQFLKSKTTDIYFKAVKAGNWPRLDKRLWQLNYWEHVVRNDIELQKLREYIVNNPVSWAQDSLHPKN